MSAKNLKSTCNLSLNNYTNFVNLPIDVSAMPAYATFELDLRRFTIEHWYRECQTFCA
ncbi:hypothetical protein [Microcoleus sp. bin38.metabat.b11b12b14.051]|uniref:hypothetical protein n=1 Tax=Microcoleus sp. bin38.metabat.b11b12b14.051 TaxID=2742709 RepID=UPI0025D590E7|nr:hypothetical protein [Microcoleus sp. bin38.metabat.b11b12b14.051]